MKIIHKKMTKINTVHKFRMLRNLAMQQSVSTIWISHEEWHDLYCIDEFRQGVGAVQYIGSFDDIKFHVVKKNSQSLNEQRIKLGLKPLVESKVSRRKVTVERTSKTVKINVSKQFDDALKGFEVNEFDAGEAEENRNREDDNSSS